MPNYYRSLFGFLSIIFLMLSTFGCSSKIDAPKVSNEIVGKDNTESSPTLPSENDESAINLEQEASIEKMCLTAWRKCVAGNKKEGIADLKKLSKQYPKSSSVLFMTGQVLEKFGDKKEALNYYERAANNSDFAVMSLFKIAESLRTAGNTEQAVMRYRKLLDIAPQFSLAHLGLAKTLMKVHPEEAQKELETVLELEPTNKEAKSLLGSSKK